MAVVIQGILEESRQYYRNFKRELVGRLLVNPRGHLRRSIVNGREYVSLRTTRVGLRKDIYLGPQDSELVQIYTRLLASSNNALSMLREAKQAMKELRMPNEDIKREDYFPVLKNLTDAFAQVGLWEAGLELVGSWCFKVYQHYCGVEYYPERTLDVDFVMDLPYKGPKVNIGDMLKQLGFQEDFSYEQDVITYRSGEMQVEFLKNRKGDGRTRSGQNEYEPDLGILPMALPYLGILLENRMTIKARDLGTVVVPSMPAFMLHKVLVAGKRKNQGKRAKDVRQAEFVAKVLLGSQEHLAEAQAIAERMHKKWRQAIAREARSIPDLHPDSPRAVEAVLKRIGVME